jgi:galactokinase
VQEVQQLKDIYIESSNYDKSIKGFHEPRYVRMNERFKQKYGRELEFYVRAPGRVNIIGEHIDYCGYSVLPAAIEQDFIMAYCLTDDDKIVLNNYDKDSYEEETISTDPFQKFKETGHYLNYFLCGYKAILALDSPWKSKVTKPKGMRIYIDSLVPPAAGLSSSSAFCVCASTLTAHANGLLGEID